MASKAVAAIFLLIVAIQGSLAVRCSTGIVNQKHSTEQCFLSKVNGIPRWHIYHQLLRDKRRPGLPLLRDVNPLVIGHRGNVQFAQENSLDGIQSVPRFGGDGFEVDVFMTKDKHLVCFHDKNTSRLTGHNGDIELMTKLEIQDLDYLKIIEYGTEKKEYNERRKIAFLDDVLDWAKTKRLLVYIEMKPEPAATTLERTLQIPFSIEMGIRVAQLVKSKGMVPQVVVNSFDVLKSLNAKKSVPDLVIGTSWLPPYWFLPEAVHIGQKLEQTLFYPGMCSCLCFVNTKDNEFIDFLFQSGTVEKSIGASFTDLELTMFNNTLYGQTNHTMCMLQKHYGSEIVVGAYTLFDVSKTTAQIDSEIPLYKELVKDRVNLFYTDDICGMRRIIRQVRRCRGRFKSNYYQFQFPNYHPHPQNVCSQGHGSQHNNHVK